MSFFRFRGGRSRILRVLAGLLAISVVAAGAGALAIYVLLIRDLPDFRDLDDYRPPVVSEVLDREGRLIGEFYTQKRRLVPIGEIPRQVQLAFVAAEDGSFFEHKGIDYVSIIRAAITNLRAGGIAQGASTITQQMVKSLLLTPERTYKRKMREIILARRIEQVFTKDEILFLYLNQIYFGNGAWGIGQAARSYFGKHAQDLTVSEAALLAGLVQRPSAYDPSRNPEAAEARRHYVLGRMRDDGYIDEIAYQSALDDPPTLETHPDEENMAVAGYFTEEVRRLLFERLGGDVVLNDGLRIETTLDVKLQQTAHEAIQRGLVAHDHRRGYRGPLRRVERAELQGELERLAETNAAHLLVIPSDAAEEITTEESEMATQRAAEVPAEPEPNAPGGDDGALATTNGETETEEPTEPTGPRELAFDSPVEGLVLEVDAEAQTAQIGFAPDVFGEARLSDVEWARAADKKGRPRSVTKISRIFRVGDVARFIRLPEDETNAAEGEASKEQPAVPLARLDIWQDPIAEGALLSLENGTGNVLALIGGYDFGRSEFNRAVQALRQPGSAFKPFIYGAALTRGFTPVSTLIDRPVVYTDPVSGFVWAPQNYGRKFHGPMTMRDALKKSINNATVHLFRDLGVRYVIDYARRLGIQAPLSTDLSLALGSSSVTLLELTRAYAVYPSGGQRVVPRFIERVVDRDGEELLADVPLGDVPPPVMKPLESEGEEALESYPDSEILPTQQLITPADAYLMSDLLRAVVQEGTGRRLRRLGRTLAGKTGTTNEYSDAWFMGFSPDLTTGVWVGNDDNQVLGWGETGARAALPIWSEFMEVALAPYPARDFEVPEDIEFQRIDRASGLIADAHTQDAYFQPFLAGTAPERSFSDHTTSEKSRQAARDDIF
ncbi:MAG: PBP1A family penicillin-binding protein [Deltaproteobacteria bacterium]|jgi:penicillin-binding protein 1A|nr:PBP1A family penicillin-binding protein [Deltaproteobacteria bacterium]MBW2500568.1 PBP1A family penicillin-binding protein [Deltaproteobacteria bacterium]